MNENIAKIQKNMVTVFEGYVNDQKFDSREAMNLYIGQCISEGKPISNISSPPRVSAPARVSVRSRRSRTRLAG